MLGSIDLLDVMPQVIRPKQPCQNKGGTLGNLENAPASSGSQLTTHAQVSLKVITQLPFVGIVNFML